MIFYVAPGLKLRDPVTKQFVPEEGMEVPETDSRFMFYTQRLGDKDVQLTKPLPSHSDRSADES